MKRTTKALLFIGTILFLSFGIIVWIIHSRMPIVEVGQIEQKEYAIQGTIYGSISNFQKFKAPTLGTLDRLIKVTVGNYISGMPQTYVNEINEDGSFVITFPLAHAQHVSFRYGGVWSGPVDLFVYPADTLHLKFNIESLMGLFYRVDGDLEVGSRHKSRHNKFRECLNYRRKQFGSFRKNNDYKAVGSTEKLLTLQEKECEEAGKYADSIRADSVLKDWLVNSIRYKVYNVVLKDPEFKIQPGLNDFYSYLLIKESDNRNALATNEYLEFLQLLGAHTLTLEDQKLYLSLFAEMNLFIDYGKLNDIEIEQLNSIRLLKDSLIMRKNYMVIRDSLNEKYPEVMEDYFLQKRFDRVSEVYQRYLKNVALDILLTNHMAKLLKSNYFEVVRNNLSRYEGIVKTQQIEELFLDRYKEEEAAYNNISLPAAARVYEYRSEKVRDYLRDVLSRYKGKVVYIDIWATWCGPCKKMFPFSKTLNSKLGGEDVVFMYLCVDSPSLSWKKAIAENRLAGEHYLVPNSVYQALKAEFEFNGIPHYVLVDREGSIIYKNARRPDDRNILNDVHDLL